MGATINNYPILNKENEMVHKEIVCAFSFAKEKSLRISP